MQGDRSHVEERVIDWRQLGGARYTSVQLSAKAYAVIWSWVSENFAYVYFIQAITIFFRRRGSYLLFHVAGYRRSQNVMWFPQIIKNPGTLDNRRNEEMEKPAVEEVSSRPEVQVCNFSESCSRNLR